MYAPVFGMLDIHLWYTNYKHLPNFSWHFGYGLLCPVAETYCCYVRLCRTIEI